MCKTLKYIASDTQLRQLSLLPIQIFQESLGQGLETVLKDCSFNKEHNFNVLHMSKLLHKQGWKIMLGDKSSIQIENNEDGVINFDIVVPTEKGVIDACKFVRVTEVATANTDVKVRLKTNVANCLLSHRNETQCIRQKWNLDGSLHKAC
jgi:hypothetical protein